MKKTTTGAKTTLKGSGFVMWTGSWELFDLPSGGYTLELTAFGKNGKAITSRREKFLHRGE